MGKGSIKVLKFFFFLLVPPLSRTVGLPYLLSSKIIINLVYDFSFLGCYGNNFFLSDKNDFNATNNGKVINNDFILYRIE
jgi:hypothetical protein